MALRDIITNVKNFNEVRQSLERLKTYVITAVLGGPTTSTDNAVARFSGTGGDEIQNSGVIIDDSDNVTGVADLTSTGTISVDTVAENSSDVGVTVDGVLHKDGVVITTLGAAGNDGYRSKVTGDTNNRFAINVGGTIYWGDGSGTVDTKLYRSGANVLATDDGFVSGSYIVASDGIYSQNAQPRYIFRDIDCTDTYGDRAYIEVECTDIGSGTEDANMSFWQDINGTMTQWLLADADGDINFGTNRSVGVSGDLVLTEKADHSSTPSAGFGYLWVKNTSPSTLIFTDDTGTDTTLGSGGGGTKWQRMLGA